MYDFEDLYRDIECVRRQGMHVEKIGKSILGREIFAIHQGDMQGKQIFVQGAIHAREWITAKLLVTMMREYDGEVGVWCVPMSNPDGCMLAVYGLDSVKDQHIREFLTRLNPTGDYRYWKANCRGVDLNVNFNADWGKGRRNVTYPCSANYIGMFPESEVETKALVGFTKRIMPYATLSYHAKGQVIYQGYKELIPYEDVAKEIADSTGYSLEESIGSAGGYKDWYVATTRRLGLTIEVGDDDCDITQLERDFDNMVAQNQYVLDILAKAKETIL